MIEPGSTPPSRGPIEYMARNGVAANLLMLLILVAGLVSLGGLVQEAFPLLRFNTIEISVRYPGATPREAEESIVLQIEEQLKAVDGIKQVRAIATRGLASVTALLKTGEDIDQKVDEIESAVARIEGFPAGAERAEVREITSRQSVIRLVISGDVPERTLKELAYRVEDELAALPQVSYVETSGVRDYEITIEVPLNRLRALGLTVDDVAAAIRRGSLDLSGGSVETRNAEVLIRTTGQSYDQHAFEDIIVLGGGMGTIVRLRDIANVRDDFADVDLVTRYGGRPAAFVEVYRTAGEQVLDVARAVEEHLESRLRPSLPPGIQVAIWNNEATTFEERRDVLLKNGFLGLVLVLLALTFFLHIRLAFWVAAGIAISLVGTLATMLFLDLSINSFSLFTFVIVIGIIVDDAIVVAEHIYLERQEGTPGVVAAIRGTRRIKKPLFFAVLTTAVGFSPLLLVPGAYGTIISPVPIILISTLAFSLIESTLILPHHLSHLPGPEWRPRSSLDRFFDSIRRRNEHYMARFTEGPLDKGLRFATRRPELVVAMAAAVFVLSVTLVPAGIVGVILTDPIEGDVVTARLEMPVGTPAARTREFARDLEEAGRRAIDRLSTDRGEEAEHLLVGVNSVVGLEARPQLGNLFWAPNLGPQSHVATVEFKLLEASRRDVRTASFEQAWREEVGGMPEARGLKFSSTLIDFGSPVHIGLSHPDPERLKSTTDSLQARLKTLAGVSGVQSDDSRGLREIQLELRSEAVTLGVSLDALARQVRSAFLGSEVLRIQRGREEVRVYVRLPPGERDAMDDVERYIIRTADGVEVPLRRVARARLGDAPAAIHREDGQRVVTVTADVDPELITGAEATAFAERTIIPDLAAANPGLTFSVGGSQQQTTESFDALGRGFAMALLVIYALLAIPLGSYTKPVIVMAAIPLGIVGALMGHVIMGISLSFMSMMGVLGLSGVVVNDSLVMMDFIDRRRSKGEPLRTAVIEGAKGRFRPIFITSITTFLGFAPLTFERGIQAQALVPVGVSIGFGIVFATAMLMLLIPALLMLYARLFEHRASRH